MNKKILIAILSLLSIFFLTAQTCSFGTMGLAAECADEYDIVCDDTEAYDCERSATGLYVSREPDYDVDYCGATEDETTDGETEETFDSETVARKLITLSSDIEEVVEDLEEIKREAAEAETDEDGFTLRRLKVELRDVRTTVSDLGDLMDTIADEIADAEVDGEEVSDVQALYDTADADLTTAETLEITISAQIVTAFAALGVEETETEEETETSTEDDSDDDGVSDAEDVCAGYDDASDNDTDGTPDGCDSDDDDDGYNDRLEFIAGSNQYDSDSVPSARDSDGDGMHDRWETYFGLDTRTDDTEEDADSDFLTNLDEYELGTDPTDEDTDGDHISDVYEVSVTETDPLVATTCMDPDGGIKHKTFGITWYDDNVLDPYPDACFTDTYLTEYYCEDNVITSERIECANGCENGACLEGEEEEIEIGVDTSFSGSLTNDEAKLSGITDAKLFLDATDTVTLSDGSEVEPIFKLEDFDVVGLSAYKDRYYINSLVEESSFSRNAELTESPWYVFLYESDNVRGIDFTEYYEDTPAISLYTTYEDPGQYASFSPDDALNPSNWMIIKLKVKVDEGDTDEQQTLVTKNTGRCYSPLYALTIEDGKYHFILSVDDISYELTSNSDVSTKWRKIMGTYDGETIRLFVGDTQEDSYSVSGEISTYDHDGSLFFGFDKACIDYDFDGYLKEIYIWGE